MAEEFELPDYINKYDLDRFKATNTPVGGAEKSERRLLRLGLLTLALLCIIQAALNLSLRLAFYSKVDVDPFNSSSVMGLCQNEQLQQNSTQLSFCCNLLTRLLREYQALERERDLLREKIQQLSRDKKLNDVNEYSGSGGMFFTDTFYTSEAELE
ncbi:hypothetical protein ATANTOWER_015271 [Ataeniobius toweri]|uniref:Uncharacterized protein n=1 Tax=Ataeniobius toweri TaxID=208326 RepID=A0ABU7AZG7_9TELE|nr:hypothetical protein [Ataeniobius toweri]